jgi:hypothetical protein
VLPAGVRRCLTDADEVTDLRNQRCQLACRVRGRTPEGPMGRGSQQTAQQFGLNDRHAGIWRRHIELLKEELADIVPTTADFFRTLVECQP